MGILAWIILGLIAGFLASMIMGSREGLIMDIVLGVIGAVVGGWVMSMLGQTGVQGVDIYSIAVATLGAVLLIWARRAFFSTY